MPKEREGGGGEGEGECERRKKVGHYVLGPCLGEGSFAKVRTGTHILSREKVAVKVVSKRLIIRREAARRNFRREALLLQHVRHPHIVCLLEAMETAHSYYLVFELAPNGNLLAYLTDRKCLREGEARRFMRQIVSAVDHLHRSSIVHRDLKLENCLLNSNWDVKIIDFGLSALCQRESGLHTQCGSPAYAAPEIFGNRRYGLAVDLWSIGVCLYAMVVGRLPFLPHPPTNLTQLHALILKGPSIPNFLSSGLQQLLSGLLEVQESRRLSISDLLSQSWLTCHQSQPIARFPPVSQAPPLPVDTQVVRYMSHVFRFSESDVIHSVTERKLNASSATYHLLKRHMEGERSAEETEENEGCKEEEKNSGGGGSNNGGDASNFGKSVASDNGKSVVNDNEKSVSKYASNATTRPVVVASSGGGPRFTASEYGRSSVVARVDIGRPVVSEYSRPLATGYESVVERVDSSRSGCPVLRSHILTPSKSPLSDDAGVERRRETLQDYKQCILYLKEARHHAFALGSRPLSHLHPHFLDRTPSSKLPVLSLHRSLPPPHPPPHPGSLHGNQASRPEGHQCSDSGSQVKLNVLGRPALPPERGKGMGVGGDKGDTPALTSQASLTSSQETGAGAGPGRPPPAPPNTAQGGMRVPPVRPTAQLSSSEADPNSPRPSTSGSGRSLCSLRDPFSRDTWRTVLHQRDSSARLAGESGEAGPRKWRGVSFVAPLSSPKALTSREVREVSAGGATSRRQQQQQRHNYFLVRQLTADFNRRRVTPGGTSSKKVTTVTPAAPTASAAVTNPPPTTTPPTSPRSLRHHHPHHHHHHHHPHPLLLHHDSSQRGEEEGREDRASLGSSGNDGGFGDALETERFLTPVIRVTITSTAKP